MRLTIEMHDPVGPRMADKAQWKDDGVWSTLVLRALMRAKVCEVDGYFAVMVLERSFPERFASPVDAKRFAEEKLREELTAALERLP